ncbi:MAG: tetratricopeptide repeat protein [bacterium]
MTPPIAPSGSPAVPLPLPVDDPQAPGKSGPEASPKMPFQGSHVLEGILKKTGRVPTHPLTAQPPQPEGPSSKEVTPDQAKKAESFRRKGDEYFKKENFKKALGYYQKAHQTNPGDVRILLSLAKAEHATGDLFQAHDHYNELLLLDPSLLQVRALRTDANLSVLAQMKQIMPRVPKEKQAEFVKTVQILQLELGLDRAALLAHNADKEIEGLKAAEQGLAKLHGKSKAEKEKACQQLLGMAMETLDLAQLPPLDPKDAKLIPEKLGMLAKEVFGVLARFAKADNDPALQRLAPLFEAYQALTDGRTEDAVKAFETVREQGLKLLGDGDAAKGEKALLEKLEKAGKSIAAKDGASAEKIFQEEIPPGLADAYGFLKQYEGEKTRMASLVATNAWEEEISSRYTASAKDANGFWGQFGQAWDIANSQDTSLDKLAKEERKELDLLAAVRSRLALGKSVNIEGALKDIVATESGDLKDRAAAFLAKLASGSDTGSLPVLKLIRLSGQAKLDTGTADTLLSSADLIGTFGACPKTRSAIYGTVSILSGDPGRRATAEAALKKLENK